MEPGEAIECHANAQVGRVLESKWRLDRVIAIGGMAVVYAATHRNGNRVAIKVLRPDIGDQEQLRQRFAREGYVANRVAHAGAVRVLDDGTTGEGSPFLVMELLEGETLDARVERRNENVSIREMLLVTEQLLEALSAAHSAGIVHRDLKPENLFLTTEGKLKVLDFGIARLAEQEAAPSGPTTETRPGSLLGTPAFMAPEQASGRWSEVDARTDIWAVGATMFTLLTGEHVHEAETINLQLAHAAMVEAPPVAERFPVPARVAELIDTALRFQKADRWQSAEKMLDAVRSILSSEPASERQLPRSSLVNVEAETLAVPLISEASRVRTSVSSVSAATTALGARSAAPRKPVIALAFIGLALVAVVLVVMFTSSNERVEPKAASTAPPGAPIVPTQSQIVSSEPEKPLVSPAPSASIGAPKAVSPTKRNTQRQTAPHSDEDLYDKRY